MVPQVPGFSQISMVLTTKGPQSFVNHNGPNYHKEGMVVIRRHESVSWWFESLFQQGDFYIIKYQLNTYYLLPLMQFIWVLFYCEK